MAEQAGHAVAPPASVLKRLAEHHVAAALAVDRPGRGKRPEPLLEAARRRKRAGMKLGIAARQPAAVAAFGRRLIGERREGDDLGTGLPPAGEHMRIDEGERRVACERDAVAGRRQRRCRSAGGDRDRTSGGKDRVEVDMPLDRIGEPVEPRVEVGMLARLHQAEMPRRQRHRLVARQRAEEGHARSPRAPPRSAGGGVRLRPG